MMSMQQEKSWSKNGYSRNSNIRALRKISTLNYMKQSKLRNKDSGRDPISFWLEKKTSMPVPVKWLWDTTRYSWSSTIHNRNLSDSMRHLYQTIYSWIRSLETILEMRKETWFRKLLNKNILSKFSKYVANNRKNTYEVVVLSRVLLSNIFKTRTTNETS